MFYSTLFTDDLDLLTLTSSSRSLPDVLLLSTLDAICCAWSVRASTISFSVSFWPAKSVKEELSFLLNHLEELSFLVNYLEELSFLVNYLEELYFLLNPNLEELSFLVNYSKELSFLINY